MIKFKGRWFSREVAYEELLKLDSKLTQSEYEQLTGNKIITEDHPVIVEKKKK